MSDSKQRIKSACIQCQKRKKRCDGAKPSCGNCSKSNAPCSWTERKPRGPGKKKNRVEQLEMRLKSLESALRRHGPAVSPVGGSEEIESTQDPQGSMEGAEKESTSGLPLRISPVLDELAHGPVIGHCGSQASAEIEQVTGPSPDQLATSLLQQEAPSPSQIISKFSEFTQGVSMGYRWIRAHETGGSFDNRVFARLPTHQQVQGLIEPVVESLQQHGVVITVGSFMKLLDEQYAAGPDCYADDSARWAIVNSFFTTSMLSRVTTDFLKEIVPTAWNYFKNSFSMLPDLITQVRDISACEALLAMAMFVQRTADAQLALQITAAAIRLVQTLGLHRSSFYLSLDHIAVERHQRVFWAAYILDVDAMEKYDLCPSLEAEELIATLEHKNSPREPTKSDDLPSFDLLRWRAKLAVIQKRIHDRLGRTRSRDMGRDQVLSTVVSINDQLQAWKRSLPERLWTDLADDDSDIALFSANLHFVFNHSMSKIQMALVHRLSSETSVLDPSRVFSKSRLEPEVQQSRTACAASARNMIQAVTTLTPQTYFHLWGILSYPLSAVLMLLSMVLQDPTSATAQDDIRRMCDFVSILKKHADEGADMQPLLNACIKLHDVSICAVNIARGGQRLGSLLISSGHSVTVEQLQSLQVKLLGVKDWLQLAEGFLSNLPILRAEGEDVLSDIFEVETSQGPYGIFVPGLVRSHVFSSTYTSN